MTAPGLYRYFGSREDLVRNVVGDIFSEVADAIGLAIRTGAGDGAAGTGEHMTAKMIAACREFRRWPPAHPGEFGLIFGSPLPGVDAGKGDFTDECGRRFAATFFTLFYELWQRAPFPVPAPATIDPGLRAQPERFRVLLGADIHREPC